MTDVTHAELAADTGSSLVGHKGSGTGAIPRTAQSKLRDYLTLSDYGTSSDATAAMDEWISDYPAGGRMVINRANSPWTVPSVINITGHRRNIAGEGRQVTVLNFHQGGVCLNFDSGAGGQVESSLSDIGFFSTDTLATKTAVQLKNVANMPVSRLSMSSTGWPGTDSIGLRTFGRQLIDVSECHFACARPVVHSPNEYYSSLAVDHCSHTAGEYIGTSASHPVIEFENGTSLSNTVISRIALVGGKEGIKYRNTTLAAASYCIRISDCRSEQGQDANAYSFDIESSEDPELCEDPETCIRGGFIQNLLIENNRTDTYRHGMRGRGVQGTVMISNLFASEAGKTALDWEIETIGFLVMIGNTTAGLAGAKSITHGRCLMRMRSGFNTSTIGPFELWDHFDPPTAVDYSSMRPFENQGRLEVGFDYEFPVGSTTLTMPQILNAVPTDVFVELWAKGPLAADVLNFTYDTAGMLTVVAAGGIFAATPTANKIYPLKSGTAVRLIANTLATGKTVRVRIEQ